MLHLKHFISHTIIELRYTPSRKTIKKKKNFLVNFPSNYFQIQAGSYQKPRLTPRPRLPPHFLTKTIEEKLKEEIAALTFNCNNQKIIILNQEKVILQLNDEVAKLKSHIKTLTKVPKEKKEEFLKDYKIPFNEKVIRRTEQAIRAETTNELVTKIKKNYKKSQKVYGLEIKRENLKIARDLEKAKQEKLPHRDKFAYLSKQLLEAKLEIPTKDKSGKLLTSKEQIRVMNKILHNRKKIKMQKAKKAMKKLNSQ